MADGRTQPLTALELKARRFDALLIRHGAAIADILHCEQRHIGLELDDIADELENNLKKSSGS